MTRVGVFSPGPDWLIVCFLLNVLDVRLVLVGESRVDVLYSIVFAGSLCCSNNIKSKNALSHLQLFTVSHIDFSACHALNIGISSDLDIKLFSWCRLSVSRDRDTAKGRRR